MNRNVESHFARAPRADVQRSVFDRSFSLKTSFNVGEVVPIFCQEILPGDTVQLNTSKVVRLQTLLTPILDSVYMDTYFFYVPMRILWKHWKEFCGENNESAWIPATEYRIPAISSPSGGFDSGTLADYFGLPVGYDWSADDQLAPSALPFRAYAKIIDEWFRDQNLKDPLLIPDDDANQVGSNGSDYVSDIANGGMPFIAAKFHDYFTSCLPGPQRGDPVTISIAGAQPYAVRPVATAFNFNQLFPSGEFIPTEFSGNLANSFFGDHTMGYADSGSGTTVGRVQANDLADNGGKDLVFTNLAVDLKDAQVMTINELRLAFATQRYLEKLTYGGRYTEVLRSLFGVTAPDASLQRPEYLGGNRIPLNVSEVTNNAQTDTDFLGDLGGMSCTADQHYDFVKSFTEHGYVIGVAVCRYSHSYSQGIDRMWLRREFLDFYQPTFANLGNMPVYTAEIFADGMTANGKQNVFGYQEAWADYRYGKDMVTGELRPEITDSLASWHLGDNYETRPFLSDEWIDEDKSNVDRVLAVTSQVSNQVFGDFYFNLKHTRPMPMYSIPGLIDHF